MSGVAAPGVEMAAPSTRRRAQAGIAALLMTCVLLASVVAWSARDAKDPHSADVVGRALPAFALPRLDDASRALSPDDLRGEVWLLNLWASWCAPCRDEHPLLVALAREQGVTIIGVAHQDDPRAADEWLRRLGNPYRWSAVDRDGRVGRAMAVDGVPQTFVVDRGGVVRLALRGPLTATRWSQEVQPLLRSLREATP
jgi:cytochrome c biogenesis protein CcmG/thiol:disulfide interchange protein DsbE